jgi:hypothetical protein
MRANAKDATERGYVPLVMERVKLVDILIEAVVGGTCRVETIEMNREELLSLVPATNNAFKPMPR